MSETNAKFLVMLKMRSPAHVRELNSVRVQPENARMCETVMRHVVFP